MPPCVCAARASDSVSRTATYVDVYMRRGGAPTASILHRRRALRDHLSELACAREGWGREDFCAALSRRMSSDTHRLRYMPYYLPTQYRAPKHECGEDCAQGERCQVRVRTGDTLLAWKVTNLPVCVSVFWRTACPRRELRGPSRMVRAAGPGWVPLELGGMRGCGRLRELVRRRRGQGPGRSCESGLCACDGMGEWGRVAGRGGEGVEAGVGWRTGVFWQRPSVFMWPATLACLLPRCFLLSRQNPGGGLVAQRGISVQPCV
ncbi:hypothetical protein C8Q80DRAFT_1178753, partial [Daedaleopsis nitida]